MFAAEGCSLHRLCRLMLLTTDITLTVPSLHACLPLSASESQNVLADAGKPHTAQAGVLLVQSLAQVSLPLAFKLSFIINHCLLVCH